ncbi:SH3 domain-containing protein [Peptoniphilus mikwangii]|uniref:SH3 domain-containing protein n=1 Tax=Peptoniphilus mikwangii TaxID=1354300 RepID=UPI000420EACC|nr:SH3 domain-containing protein [Peptoniphilus mikwangii]
MKCKFKILAILCLVIALNISACGKASNDVQNEEKNKTENAQTNAKAEEENSKEENVKEEDKVEENIKIDKDIAEFTSKYLDFYNQDGNAYVEISFEEKNFVPEKVWKKVEFIETYNKDDVLEKKPKFYKMLISCNNNVLFDVVSERYSGAEKSLGKFKLNKGEAFIMPIYDRENSSCFIRANKFPDLYVDNFADMPTYFGYETEFTKEISFNAFKWKKMLKPDLLANGYSYESTSKKQGNVDLDGDKKLETIYFVSDGWADSLNEDGEMEYAKFKGRFEIDEKDFDLTKIIKDEVYGKGMDENDTIYDLEVIDIDPNDNYKELALIISRETGNDILMFHYKNGELKFIGGAYQVIYDRASICTSEKEPVFATRAYEHMFFPYVRDIKYELKDEKFVELEFDTNEMFDFDSRITVYPTKVINIYKTPTDTKPIGSVNKDDVLLLLETDGKLWIKVKVFESGETGYVRLEHGNKKSKFENSLYDQPEVDAETMFEGTPAYGR